MSRSTRWPDGRFADTSDGLGVRGDVGYAARVLGVWWASCCRIVEVVDDVEPDGTRRFGFAYATLRGHAERGEERFLVLLQPDGVVTFELFAISQPGRWFTWIGLPVARRAQARFRPGAAAAVRDGIRRRVDPSPVALSR